MSVDEQTSKKEYFIEYTLTTSNDDNHDHNIDHFNQFRIVHRNILKKGSYKRSNLIKV